MSYGFDLMACWLGSRWEFVALGWLGLEGLRRTPGEGGGGCVRPPRHHGHRDARSIPSPCWEPPPHSGMAAPLVATSETTLGEPYLLPAHPCCENPGIQLIFPVCPSQHFKGLSRRAGDGGWGGGKRRRGGNSRNGRCLGAC